MSEIKFVNLTPHQIVLVREDGSKVTIPPSGMVARVRSERQQIGSLNGFPVFKIIHISESGERKEKVITTQGRKPRDSQKVISFKVVVARKRRGKSVFGIVQMIENNEAGFKTLRDFAINSLPDDHELRKELREIEEEEKKALDQWRKENEEILERIRELMEDW